MTYSYSNDCTPFVNFIPILQLLAKGYSVWKNFKATSSVIYAVDVTKDFEGSLAFHS